MKKTARQTEREKQIYINRDILQHEKLFLISELFFVFKKCKIEKREMNNKFY